MIYSQFYVLFNIICSILFPILNFDDKYLKLVELPWDIIFNLSTISLITELHKYIVIFDFITFLGFSQQFSSRFKKFTNFITYLIKIISVLFLLLTFVRSLIIFENEPYLQLFGNLVHISLSIRN